MTARSLLVLLGLCGLHHANAHGRMTSPPARQLGCGQDASCGSENGLVGGGPGSVHNGGGYLHGICGDAPGGPQVWAEPAAITDNYYEGQTVTFEAVLTAHHIGFIEFELCPSPAITEDCFKQHRLRRTDCQGPDEECRKWWKPLVQSETSQYAASSYPASAPVLPGGFNTVPYMFRMNFDLPPGVSCTHCVLRWHYLTTNSCTSATSNPEEFWNCADIRIDAASGSTAFTDNDAAGVDLVNTQPVDLRPFQDDAVDFWNCPRTNVPAASVGLAHEYTCDLGNVANGGCLDCQNDINCPNPVPVSLSPTANTPTPQPTPLPTVGSNPTPQPTHMPSGHCGTCVNGCLWVEYGACYPWSEAVCSGYSGQGYAWCGDGTGPQPTNQPTSPAPQPTPYPSTGPQPTPMPTDDPTSGGGSPPGSSCGSCTGCLWVQHNACYGTWTQSTCQLYAPDYQWCGGGSQPTNQPTAGQQPTLQPTSAQQPTPQPTPNPTSAGGAQCVSHAQLMAINGESSYWPNCDPSMASKGSATGYVFGYYCTTEWTYYLNQMLDLLGYCNQPETIRKFLAQAAYETGYYSTLGQPLDAGSGVIHMIPQNFDINAQDMDVLFPGSYAAYQAAVDKQAFFKDPVYAWKSAAAWFKLTNRVIAGCGQDLFDQSLDDQTRCILGRVVSRDEAYNLVSKHIPLSGTGPSPTPQPTTAAQPTTAQPTPPPTTRQPTVVGQQTGWERIMSPDLIAKGHPWGISNFRGLQGTAAAQVIFEDVADAIKNGPQDFQDFCNGPDEEANKRECAAFIANVLKETGGYSAFVEVSPAGTYCTENGEGGADLIAAGADYPCYGNSFIGRGAIQLTWNINYGKFSEFYFGDKNVLLQSPEQVEGDGPLGWAASLWFWMRDQDYGGQCPPVQLDSVMSLGHQSCHSAMGNANGGGFGQTIRIINGGYESCPTSSYRNSAIARIQYYLELCSLMGVPAAPGCALDDPNCDVSGMGFYASTNGEVGNPLIGSDPSSECPNCAKAACSSSPVSKWLGTDHDPVDKLQWTCN